MCYNGFEAGDTEAEREAAQPWETEGDLSFLPEADHEWRPELAGPEYWLYKRRLEEGEDEPPQER